MDSSSSSPVADAFNFVAIKLDSEGAEVWRWQVRQYIFDHGHHPYAKLPLFA